jgi:toxin ParE1/3/4
VSRYIVSPAARQDLADIKAYLVLNTDKRAAGHVLESLRDGIRKISAMPGIGHPRPDLGGPDLRFFHVFKYLIMDRPDRRPLEIARILHGSRDVRRILKRGR